MSHRPIIEKKKRRLVKSLRNTPPAWIDLIDYLKLRTRCTTGKAKAALMAGVLYVDSHPIGYKWEKNQYGESVKVLDPYVPAHLRGQIQYRDPTES